MTDNRRSFKNKTYIFSLHDGGKFSIYKEMNIGISEANSLAVAGNKVYFGQDKMITELDLMSEKVRYLTDKADDELEALVPIR